MTRIHRESVMSGGFSARELLQPSEDVVEAWKKDDSTPCIPDGKRLLRVLVVDDNRDAADSLSMLVNLWRHDGRAAYGGAEALEMASVRQPDVVLVDLSMPKMDGCQMARRLRQQAAFAETLLIAVTGWTDQAHRLLCDEAGFDHYLIKPLDLSRLEYLLLLERWWLTRSTEEVEKTKGPTRTRMTGAKKTECRTAADKVCS